MWETHYYSKKGRKDQRPDISTRKETKTQRKGSIATATDNAIAFLLVLGPGCSEIVLLKDQQSQLVADEEAEQPAGDLERGELPGEAVLAEGSAPDEPQVQDGQVARLLDELRARLLVDALDDLEQAQLLQQADGGGDGPRGLPLGRPGRDRGLEQAGPRVEPGQAVARAGDDVEQLGRRVKEVGDLRDQQQHEGLAEVAQDADDDEDHAGEVAVRVPDEDARRVLVVREEREAHAQKGQEEIQAEQMAVHRGVWVCGRQVEGVVEDQQERDDD